MFLGCTPLLSFSKHQQLVCNHSIVSSDQKTWYSMHNLLQVVFSILQSGLKCLFCRSGVLVCSLKVRSRAGFQWLHYNSRLGYIINLCPGSRSVVLRLFLLIFLPESWKSFASYLWQAFELVDNTCPLFCNAVRTWHVLILKLSVTEFIHCTAVVCAMAKWKVLFQEEDGKKSAIVCK